MKLLLQALALVTTALGALLVDFNAARGDDPKVLGLRNLEAARDDKRKFVANNANDNGANIPLSLEFVDSTHLQFRYQASSSVGRVGQWQKTINPNQRYKIGIAINTASPGWVELYIDGKQQVFGDERVKRLTANTFPGRADPKFGAYRGEEIDIDTFVYDVQIGENKEDVARAAGF
ncbi:hypothetical protein P171DRAFT_485664 [Karstenula rhodostoma CBS 690.94]|uniref:Concanavalin A-like lectin/glucanase n=1 Tax=Karstenula rhodostoma CBS 690.94 TaxID=1392251 RepID=A0A9P4UCI9_9PLEO|nr:hypothetical protein P171DRAFT_485664 [Karstenula rhodostoma CBS 690.94]